MNKGRTLVIGDTHGAAKALAQVLERAKVTPEDKIVHLGDVADGWSETSKCVEILLELNKTNECIFIRGNHDVWVYDWAMYGAKPYGWVKQGGKATIESYGDVAQLMDKRHKDFWKNQIDYHIDDENRVFIHGGWDYLYPFETGANMPVDAGSIAKECHWNRSLFSSAKQVEKMKGSFRALDEFKEVFIGHTSQKEGHPVKYFNLWNMDSGAGWSGVQSIMDVDTKEYWVSDPVQELYKDEGGRR